MAFLLLLIHIFSTWAMIGLIWFVQVVHYPLFAKVGLSSFAEYERSHQKRTTMVVAPFMIVEAASAVALLAIRPRGVSDGIVSLGVAIVAAIWLSTAMLQVPAHDRLKRAFSALTHRSLVVSNWLRTVGWSARGLVVVWMALEAAEFMTSSG